MWSISNQIYLLKDFFFSKSITPRKKNKNWQTETERAEWSERENRLVG